MTMLSSTGAYAVRAVLFLAAREGQGPVRVDDVARALDVPRNYLSKVLHALVKEGLLRSVRGPRGGFELAVASSSVTLIQVVEPFDEIEARRSCLLGCGECRDSDPCVLHEHWRGVAEDVATFFRETALDDVVHDTERVSAILGQ